MLTACGRATGGRVRQTLLNRTLAAWRATTAIPAAAPTACTTSVQLTAAAVCSGSSSRIVGGGPAYTAGTAGTAGTCDHPCTTALAPGTALLSPHAAASTAPRGGSSCFATTVVQAVLFGTNSRVWCHQRRQNHQHQHANSRCYATDADTRGGGGRVAAGRRTDVKGAFGKPKKPKKDRPYRASKWHIISNKNIQVSQSPGEIFQELEVS